MVANRLTLNPHKTHVLIVPNKIKSNIQITMNKVFIPLATSVKYLGIKIEPSLNFSNQIEKIEKKSQSLLVSYVN